MKRLILVIVLIIILLYAVNSLLWVIAFLARPAILLVLCLIALWCAFGDEEKN